MSYYRHGPFRGSGHGVTIGVPPLTPVVRSIMIACGAVWAVQFIAWQMGSNFLAAWLGVVPSATLRGALWQPVTYMWLHAPNQIMHILFNMLFLWLLGGDLERRWGSRAFLSYYLVCGIGAAPFIVAAGFLSQRPDAVSLPTIGASGAIFGIIVAFGMVFAERPILFMLIFPMKARTFAILLFFIALISAVGGGGAGNVSHVGHVGGAVVGYLYLKRAWRLGDFYRELRWKIKRRSFRVIPPPDDDPWVN